MESVGFVVMYLLYIIPVYAAAIAFSVIAYILTGKSLSAIARRRGIDKPWLAWVPVGCDWLLGCISDQYRYVNFGEESNRRSKLLKMNIFLMAIAVVILTLCGVIGAIAALGGSDDTILVMALFMIVLAYGMIPVAVVYSINYYKSMFDLFRSCDPDKSLIYLLVSIFASFPLPFFLHSCKEKDLGMPPRKDQLSDAE
jgi:hypothetical protein